MSCSLDEADKVRAMLEYQEIRLDERTKGLLSLQGLLFAALGFSWGKIPGLPLMFCFVGLMTSMSLVKELSRTENSIKVICAWWNHNRGDYVGPPVLEPDRRIVRYLGMGSTELLFFAIGIAWGALTGAAVMDVVRHNFHF